MDKVDEVINAILEQMKAPDIAKQAFEDLAARVRTLQGLARKQ